MSESNNVNTIWTGSKGELWINNTDKIARVQKFSLKQTNKYEDVDDTDNFATQKRLVGCELSGEIVKFKTDFAFNEIMQKYSKGNQPEISLVAKVTNVDTGETRRISVTGVTFSDMDILAFEKGKANQDSIPFSAGGYEFIA